MAIVLLLVSCRSDPATPPAEVLNEGTTFDIYWPPRDLGQVGRESSSPLLNGELTITPSAGSFQLQITLRRPHDESDRQHWNETLAFPEHDWMSKVRVWDAEHLWLWPNLPFLLRAHGEERIERYGGIDPGKGVDNDFAAVLIRPLGSNSSPMVSADWTSEVANSDRSTVVHTATSDVFTIHLSPSDAAPESGHIGIWLIYADFLGASPPRKWPRTAEYDGGILAYLEITWKTNAKGALEFNTQHLVPASGTGFDWVAWSTGTSALEKRLELPAS